MREIFGACVTLSLCFDAGEERLAKRRAAKQPIASLRAFGARRKKTRSL